MNYLDRQLENLILNHEYGALWFILICAVTCAVTIFATMKLHFYLAVLLNFLNLRSDKKGKHYTREELKAAGYEVIDNSDLRELLRQAIELTRKEEDDRSFIGGLHKLKQATKQTDGTK